MTVFFSCMMLTLNKQYAVNYSIVKSPRRGILTGGVLISFVTLISYKSYMFSRHYYKITQVKTR